MKKVPMTKNGLLKLQVQLNKLKKVKRKNIIKDIKKAREYGDIKENAEYHAAKEEQYLIEKKIKDIENKLAYANVIEITKIQNIGKVIFGTTVKLLDLNKKKYIIYTIVGEDEADIKNNKISINSPIARALILKPINDIVIIDAPGEKLKYQIKNIEHI